MEKNNGNRKETYNEQVVRLAYIESIIQYIYNLTERFDNIEDIRSYCREKLINFEKYKIDHLDSMIDNPFSNGDRFSHL